MAGALPAPAPAEGDSPVGIEDAEEPKHEELGVGRVAPGIGAFSALGT